MVHVRYDIKQGSPEWKEARKGKFTGSNAPKLLGEFGANDWARAIESSFHGNFHTKRGHILEDEALELYERIYKSKVGRPSYVTNDDLLECLYSPDGDDETHNILLEVKCFAEPAHRKLISDMEKAREIKVMAQTHFGMLVWEKPAARLIAYNPEIEDNLQAFRVFEIPRNERIIDNFKRKLQKGGVHADK